MYFGERGKERRRKGEERKREEEGRRGKEREGGRERRAKRNPVTFLLFKKPLPFFFRMMEPHHTLQTTATNEFGSIHNV